MNFFAGSPFLKALGWALLNSIWQFGIMWLLFWILTASLRKLTAAARHTLSVYLLTAGSIWFLISLSWKYYSYPSFTDNSFTVESTGFYNAYHTVEQSMDGLMPYWSVLYLLCIAALFAKFCLFIRQAGELQTKGISKMPVDWRMYVRNTAAQLGISRKVEVVLSSLIDTPQIVGFLKPIVLVPVACLNHLTIAQLEAVLLHELVHIKRNDYLTNIFLATAEILFFFNPFVKQLAAAARREREYSCDDMVIQFRHQPHNYATALLVLEQNRNDLALLPAGIAANGHNQKQLLERIQRITGIRTTQHKFNQAGAYLFALLLLGFVAMVNPAKVAVDKVMPALITLAHIEKPTTAAPNGESAVVVKNDIVKKESARKINLKLQARAAKRNEPAPEIVMEDAPVEADFVSSTAAATQWTTAVNMHAAEMEKRDFALPENNAATAAIPDDAPDFTPYVPSNSFSYQLMSDSTQPKEKRETYREHVARQAAVKVELTLKTINWKQLEKNLKLSKQQLAKLKAELAKQLCNASSRQAENNVLANESLEKLELLNKMLTQQKTLEEYKRQEAVYQDVQRQLMERDQFIRETDKRMMEQGKALEDKEKKIQTELKKRRIIVL
jgi:beta-lactamase regulating signal transducer with metallopeptidase domain